MGGPDETSNVSSSLVRKSSGSVQQSPDGVGLDTSSDEGGTEEGGRSGGLFGVKELVGRAGLLGALVGVTEDWC